MSVKGSGQQRTAKRLLGIDRSGPEPEQTRAGSPLNPWTLPNALAFLRLALMPVFVWLALTGESDGVSLGVALFFCALAFSDYFDGLLARLTGQYSRLGALLDPFADRLLILSGVVVCWNFELLPRWLLAIGLAREFLMLPITQYGLKRGVDIQINWFGRFSVWPMMGSAFWAMVGFSTFAHLLLYSGVLLGLISTVIYVRSGVRQIRGA